MNKFAVTTAWISSLVTAVLALLVAFNVALTDDQQKAILALAGVLAPLAVLAAQKVGAPTE